MKTLGRSMKITLVSTALTSVVVVAGVIQDIQRNTPDFMLDNQISYEVRLDETFITNREIASSSSDEIVLPAAVYIPFNQENREKLDGQWEFLRVTNTNGQVLFDSERPEDQNMMIEVEVTMVGTSMVLIDEDYGLEYDISYLHESGSAMAVFRQMNDGYEVIEMRKIQDHQVHQQPRRFAVPSNNSAQRDDYSSKGVEINGYYDMTLLSAIDHEVTSDVMRGFDVDGELRVSEGEIEALSLTLHRGTKNEKSIDMRYVRIEDGGIFNANGSSGIILNNGNDSYRVRFSTGPLADVQAIFVTYEERNRVEDLERENMWRAGASEEEYYEDNGYFDEGQSRGDGYMSLEDMDYEYQMYEFDSVEAMNTHTENSGFSFSSTPN